MEAPVVLQYGTGIRLQLQLQWLQLQLQYCTRIIMPVPVPGEIHSTVDSRPRHRALVPSLNPIQYPCYKNKVHWQYPYPVPVIRNTVQSFFSFLRGSFYYSTGTVPVATYYENLFIDPPPPKHTHTHEHVTAPSPLLLYAVCISVLPARARVRPASVFGLFSFFLCRWTDENGTTGASREQLER